MTIISVDVKWNRNIYNNIPLDLSQPSLLFKTQLYSITGVSPDRQKIMIKGGILKDDTDMNTLSLKPNQTIMMMGTVGELPKAPDATTQFVEDMTEAQLSKALKIPVGLVNLGNTCYLSATLQCLRAVPELQHVLSKLSKTMTSDQKSNLVASLATLFESLNTSGEPIPPIIFLQVFRLCYPQFAEQDRSGFLQQDAEEAWGQIIHVLGENLSGLTLSGDLDHSKRFIDQFMTIETISTIKCDENSQEAPNIQIEAFNKLRVNIGSGFSTYMLGDIEAGFVEKIEKNSATLNRSAMYTKTTKINRLPDYLTINFVRFQWKAQEKVKAKILKKVKFPFELDMISCCTPELIEKFGPARARLKELDDAKVNAKKQKLDSVDDSNAATLDKPKSLDQREIYKNLGVPTELIQDIGANVSGHYDLVAVLTHVGRAADSGHYIGWVKQKASNDWWKYDDDKVSPCSQEDILKLEGGGDWHSAYICLYRSKQLE